MNRRKNKIRPNPTPKRGSPKVRDQIQTIAKQLDAAAEIVKEHATNGWVPFDSTDNSLQTAIGLISQSTDDEFQVETIDGYEDAVCGYTFENDKFRLIYCIGAMQYCCMRRGLNQAEAFEEINEVVLATLQPDGPMVIGHAVAPSIRMSPELLEFAHKLKDAADSFKKR